MKKGLRKLMSGLLAAAMVVTSAGVQSENVDAANKMASVSKITMKVGAKKVIKIKNVTKKMKVKAKVNKPKVVKVTVKKNKIILKGKKVGKAKLTITVKKDGKKVTTIKRKIVVKAADATVTPAPATATTAAAAAQATATPATTAAAQATVAPEATAEATAEPTENPKEVKQLVTYDTTTNLLDEPVEKEIVGGYELTKNDDGVYEGTAKDSITIESYDNGEVRKDMSTQDLIKNEMGQGINVGNTMEATKAVADLSKYTEATQFEQAWGASLTSPEYIEALQTYGINTIRIPVAWASMTSDDGEYTISPKMLGRVEQIVNYALNAGMYVIVNDHWDYGWWGEFGQIEEVDTSKNSNVWAHAGEATEFTCDIDGDGTEETYKYNTEAMKRYTSYWKQITERFKGYSDHLIFESANEELGPNLNLPIGASGLTEDTGVKGTLGSNAIYAVSNLINQTFVDLVRESGGNNAYRHLLIAGYNTNIKSTCDDKYVMPTDTEENGTTKLSVSVHFYDPWAYCGDGMKGASYKNSDYEKAIENFELLKKFTDAGYGVIMGEFAVCNPKQDQVCEWLYDCMKLAADNGYILPVLWDTPGTYFDRLECKMKYKDVAELYNTVTGSKGDASMEATTGYVETVVNKLALSEIDENLTEENLKDSAAWYWEGIWYKNDGGNFVGENRAKSGDSWDSSTGEKVTEGDVTKFVTTSDCTNIDDITFNVWGYQTFIHPDWSQFKNPYIYVTTKVNDEYILNSFQYTPIKSVNETGEVMGSQDSVNAVILEYADYNGKAIQLPAESLKTTYPVLFFTYGGYPDVTGIYILDVAE